MIYYVEADSDPASFKIIFSDKANAGIQETDDIITLDKDLGKCSFFKDSDNKILFSLINDLVLKKYIFIFVKRAQS